MPDNSSVLISIFYKNRAVFGAVKSTLDAQRAILVARSCATIGICKTGILPNSFTGVWLPSDRRSFPCFAFFTLVLIPYGAIISAFASYFRHASCKCKALIMND